MITIVIGKPGTGKSYHTVRYLAQYLSTLARKDKIERSIYTNLSVNIDALQKYFDRKAIKIDVSKVVFKVDDLFLKYDETYLERGEKRTVKRGNKEFLEVDPRSKAFFWNRFPDNALIIIDEIQKYLSNIKEVGDSEEQSLVEYFSLHRHKKHDWIFLTQNLMSLSISVRRVSEKVVETLNSKQLTLPFPLSIPIRDIQTVLLGFGIQNQIYRVREGRLDGSFKVVYDGPIEPVVMKKEIFDLYQTHTLIEDGDSVGVQSDSEIPFDLGKGSARRAVWWFTKKHWFHLSVKAVCFWLAWQALCMFFGFMRSPDWLNLLAGDITINEQADIKKPSQALKTAEIIEKELISDENIIYDDFNAIAPQKAPITITRIVLPGVVIENGVSKEVGSLTVDGRVVKSIDVRTGVVYGDPVKYYYSMLDQLERDRRWLCFQRRVNSQRESEDL